MLPEQYQCHLFPLRQFSHLTSRCQQDPSLKIFFSGMGPTNVYAVFLLKYVSLIFACLKSGSLNESSDCENRSKASKVYNYIKCASLVSSVIRTLVLSTRNREFKSLTGLEKFFFFLSRLMHKLYCDLFIQP